MEGQCIGLILLHKVSARRDRNVSPYSKQFDKLFHHVSYGGTHNANSQPYADWDAEENRTDKGKGMLGKDRVWSGFSHLPGRRSDFRDIIKVPVSRDL